MLQPRLETLQYFRPSAKPMVAFQIRPGSSAVRHRAGYVVAWDARPDLAALSNAVVTVWLLPTRHVASLAVFSARTQGKWKQGPVHARQWVAYLIPMVLPAALRHAELAGVKAVPIILEEPTLAVETTSRRRIGSVATLHA